MVEEIKKYSLPCDGIGLHTPQDPSFQFLSWDGIPNGSNALGERNFTFLDISPSIELTAIEKIIAACPILKECVFREILENENQ